MDKNNFQRIVFNEYELNKFIMKHFPESDSSILILSSSLNNLVTIYNSDVREFNFYYSIFPNFFFAKKMNLKREKYFDIEYGKENEDPIVKSKKFPEWAKNVDTI